MANTLLTGGNTSGHDEGTTRSAVSDGTIVVRNGADQRQDVNDLSRDVEHANGSIGQIFDKEKEQKRLEQAQMIGEIGNQVMDIARTEGDIAALNASRKELAEKKVFEPDSTASAADKKAYQDKLIATDSYKATQKQWGTGSAIQQGIQAATAAVQGLAAGDIKAAIAGGAAPYLAEVIHKMTTDENGNVNKPANLMAHAVVGAVVAQLEGNSALAGAAGATAGEFIAQRLYPGVKRSDLTEEQRQTISALSTLASALAGGVAGNSTASAVAGAQAGKNAAENNNSGDWGALIPPAVQQDSSLAVELAKQGKSSEEISSAINEAHLAPSLGVEYKVKPNGKVEVSIGAGPGAKGGAEINNDYFSVTSGYTKEFGVNAGASIGIDFGPYGKGMLGNLERDYSGSIGLGMGSIGVSAGKDGIGFSFSVGPSIGFGGSSKENHEEKIELNGDTTKEIYHHDF